MLLAIPHALLGWPALSAPLRDAGVAPDVVAGLRVAWYFGSAAMVAMGGVVVTLAPRVASQRPARNAVSLVGLFYLVVGAAATVYRSPKPQFGLFVAVGLLIVVAAQRARFEDG
jgi:hypothetical protein